MSDYVRLKEAPEYVMHYPTCSACGVDLDFEEGWTCPVCGTSWDSSAGDGDSGTLYEAWSGEEATGPELTPEQAFQWGAYLHRLDCHKRWPDLYPDAPRRPVFEEQP